MGNQNVALADTKISKEEVTAEQKNSWAVNHQGQMVFNCKFRGD